MGDFKKYDVWQSSHKIVLDIYQITSTFPREELFGLTSQIRRSVVSIPNNIAEGCGRNSDKEFANFRVQINIFTKSITEDGYPIWDYYKTEEELMEIIKIIDQEKTIEELIEKLGI